MDLFDKCSQDGGYFGRQRAGGDTYFTRPILPAKPNRIMEFDGKPQIMWSINNYLGLANHPDALKRAHQAIDEFGVSSPMGSRMMSGNSPHHIALEKRLAEVAQKEAAFLFNYGYLGVLGTIQALVGKDDTVVMDKLGHACLVDGAFMSTGTVRVFKHNNMEDLRRVLKSIREGNAGDGKKKDGGILILTEGVYGMTGDLAKLDEIVPIKDEFGARIFVDDAHGWGVMGEKGRGTADYLGVQDGIDVYFGTFAKAFGSIGGFSASRKDVVEYIMYNARTQVFAKSLPMVYVESLDTTLDLVTSGDDRRKRMWDVSNRLKDGLRELGYYIGGGNSPICSVFTPIGNDELERVGGATVKYLRDRGVFVTAITYPVIPLGLLMFRMIPTAAHLDEDVVRTIDVFRSMRDDLGLDLEMRGDDKTKVARVFGGD